MAAGGGPAGGRPPPGGRKEYGGSPDEVEIGCLDRSTGRIFGRIFTKPTR